MTPEKSISEKKTMKKRLIHNLIELAIWLVLLWMCYSYLQSHPAERISFFSWYKVIYQQTEIFFQNLFGKNGEWLKQKYSLESYYQVMITQAEEKPCVNPEVVKDLHKTYEALQDEPKNTLDQKLQYYIEKQYEFDVELRKECPIENKGSIVLETDEEVSSDAQTM